MKLVGLLSLITCLAFPATGRAAGASTFSDTEQSRVVRLAIAALRSGDEATFRGLLAGDARDQYGSAETIGFLRKRFERLASGTSSLETRSDTRGVLKGDSLFLIANRSYAIDVLGRRGAQPDQLDPIWSVSVSCIGLSLVDAFGKTDSRCQISSISAHARAADPSPQLTPSVAAKGGTKELRDSVASAGDPVLVPAISSLESAGSAGSAGTNRKPW